MAVIPRLKCTLADNADYVKFLFPYVYDTIQLQIHLNGTAHANDELTIVGIDEDDEEVTQADSPISLLTGDKVHQWSWRGKGFKITLDKDGASALTDVDVKVKTFEEGNQDHDTGTYTSITKNLTDLNRGELKA